MMLGQNRACPESVFSDNNLTDDVLALCVIKGLSFSNC